MNLIEFRMSNNLIATLTSCYISKLEFGVRRHCTVLLPKYDYLVSLDATLTHSVTGTGNHDIVFKSQTIFMM